MTYPLNAKCSSVHSRIPGSPGPSAPCHDVLRVADEDRAVAQAREAGDVLDHLGVVVRGQRRLVLAAVRHRQPADEVGQPHERRPLEPRVLVQEVVEVPGLVADPGVVLPLGHQVVEDVEVVDQDLVHPADRLEGVQVVLPRLGLDVPGLVREPRRRGMHPLPRCLEELGDRRLREPVDLDVGHAARAARRRSPGRAGRGPARSATTGTAPDGRGGAGGAVGARRTATPPSTVTTASTGTVQAWARSSTTTTRGTRPASSAGTSTRPRTIAAGDHDRAAAGRRRTRAAPAARRARPVPRPAARRRPGRRRPSSGTTLGGAPGGEHDAPPARRPPRWRPPGRRSRRTSTWRPSEPGSCRSQAGRVRADGPAARRPTAASPSRTAGTRLRRQLGRRVASAAQVGADLGRPTRSRRCTSRLPTRRHEVGDRVVDRDRVSARWDVAGAAQRQQLPAGQPRDVGAAGERSGR